MQGNENEVSKILNWLMRQAVSAGLYEMMAEEGGDLCGTPTRLFRDFGYTRT